jgi:hypothetical protein
VGIALITCQRELRRAYFRPTKQRSAAFGVWVDSKQKFRLATGKYQGRAFKTMVAESNPLQQFFQEMVGHTYGEAGIRNAEVQDYVANLLAEFYEADTLYKIRNAEGRPLHDVGEMLLESDPIYGAAASFDRERQVRKHIGDYALFLTGMFPESLNHTRLGKSRIEAAVDFVRAGKESYYIVSKFEHFEYTRVAPLFLRMSQEFEQLVYGLNQMKNELAEMQHPIFVKRKEFLM